MEAKYRGLQLEVWELGDGLDGDPMDQGPPTPRMDPYDPYKKTYKNEGG